jgi:hypothetical protein
MDLNRKEIGTGLWLISGLAILFSILLAFMNLEEYYKIYFLGKPKGYPFGWEGLWYYKTAEIYSKVSLIWGILFMLSLGYLTISMIKKNRFHLIFSVALSIVLVVVYIFRNGTDMNY